MRKQAGFTLIELVMVILLIGVLAAVALPKFVDLESEARGASVTGIAGSLSSAAAINYATYKASNGAKGIAIDNCTKVANALMGGLPSGFTITSQAVAKDSSATCTLSDNQTPANTANFTALGVGP